MLRQQTISELKNIDPNKIWIPYENLKLEENLKPEFQCVLLKKGRIFTNSYNFVFYNEFCLTNKVINKHDYRTLLSNML